MVEWGNSHAKWDVKKQVVNILTRLHRSRPLMTQLKKLGYPCGISIRIAQFLEQPVANYCPTSEPLYPISRKEFT